MPTTPFVLPKLSVFRSNCWLALLLLAGCQPSSLDAVPLAATVESRLGLEGDDEVPASVATAYAAATALAPAALPGQSRTNPLPATTELITRNDWEIVVLETQRGAAAWELIRTANSNNAPPAPGEEYFLVKFWVKNGSSSQDEESLGLHLTGNGLATHFSFAAGVVVPEPRLETYLPGGSEHIGWQAYRINEGEGNLMLLVDDWSAFDDYLYVALEPNAVITVPEALRSLEPTAVGANSSDPAPFGQMVTNEDWQVRVVDVVSGEEAWQLVLAANQFNDPPPTGQMYLAVRVWLRYIGLDEGPHYTVDDGFAIVGNGVEQPSVVDPEPELLFELFPGGEAEGWLVRLVAAEAANEVLRFAPANGEFDERFLSLAVSGR